MKQVLMSGLMSFSLILSATFSPLGFAAPELEDPGSPSPVSDQNTDINWSEEAELLSFLQTASQEDLQTMSDETYDQIISNTKGTAAFTGIVASVMGGVGIVLLVRSLAKKPIVKANVAGAILAIVAGAACITMAMATENGTITRNLSTQDLKQIVGEDLANQVIALQQVLSTLDQKLNSLPVALQVPKTYAGKMGKTLILFPGTDIPMTDHFTETYGLYTTGRGSSVAQWEETKTDSQPYAYLSQEASEAFMQILKMKILERIVAMNFAEIASNEWQRIGVSNDILREVRSHSVSFYNVVFREDPRQNTADLSQPPPVAYTQQTYSINIGQLLDFSSRGTFWDGEPQVLLISLPGSRSGIGGGNP